MTKKQSKLKKLLMIFAITLSVLLISFLLFMTVIFNKYDLNKSQLTSLNNGILVYSASGNDSTMYNTNRSIIDIETLPSHVKDAFIAVEDKRFYAHNGYDLKRIIKSLMVNFMDKSKSQGASTISQQLIKNALLSNEKTYQRKIKEVVLSVKMENDFSKDEILEMYLNTIYFGSNAYGIENASKIYFNKSAKDLSLNEACCLAGIIKSPKHYSPKLNYDNAIKRKNLVATLMLDNDLITKSQYNTIINSPIELTNEKFADNSYEEEAIYEACELLNITERELINKKYQIITFKDDNLHDSVVKINNNVINKAKTATNSNLDSLSVITNKQGHILSYYSNSNYNLHNLTRQPASTLKPLAVYLPCFEHNVLSPASLILDEEINYNGFSPKNADNSYHGYVTCRDALSNSLNVPAVKALDYLGVKKAKETLADLGINISNSDLNLSLALGATKNGVKLIDLLSAYNTLSNYGEHYKLCFVNKILDENNNIVYSHENYSTQIRNQDSCFLITDILKDCAKTGTAKRLESLNIPIASKTGTASNNNQNTDLYNISYTTEHTMLSWIANIKDNVLDSSLLSSSQTTDINKEICKVIYSNHAPKDFVKPENVVKCGFDLEEFENNHILVQPNHNVERYILYDYFKENNQPPIKDYDDDFEFSINLEKTGANLSFNVRAHKTYNLVKKTKSNTVVIKTIQNQSGDIVYKDTNVFPFEEIEYYFTNEFNEKIGSSKIIRPKDFLINMLNNELISTKKRWLV